MLEFSNAAFWIVPTDKLLQIIPYQLIEAFAEQFRLLARLSDELLVDRKGYIHMHIIRVHVMCVNRVVTLRALRLFRIFDGNRWSWRGVFSLLCFRSAESSGAVMTLPFDVVLFGNCGQMGCAVA